MDLHIFNSLYNPSNEAVYVPLYNGAPAAQVVQYTYQEIVNLMNVDFRFEIGWVIPKGFVILKLDLKDSIIEKILLDRQDNILAAKYPDGYRIFCRGNFNKTTTWNILACGLSADTVVYEKGKKNIVCLPITPTRTISNYALSIETLVENEIKELPHYLTPTQNYSLPTNENKHRFPINSGIESALRSILYKMKHSKISMKAREEVIKITNDYLTTDPRTEDELNRIIEQANEDLAKTSFFDSKGSFLHNKTGDFLIDAFNIKKDKESNTLYFYNEDENIYSNNTDYLIGALTAICPTLKDFQKQEVLKYIDSKLTLSPVEFNTNPFTVVFKNGILDVITLEFEPMSPEHLETIKINANYDQFAYHKAADEFFETATQGDKGIETLLYEAIGYAMLKTNELAKMFTLVGEGRNGKSTYLDIIRFVLGEHNTVSISPRDISTSNFRVAKLENKLASLAGDISNQPLQDSDILKSISAGEQITIERKYKDPTDKKLFSTLFYACNALPRTPDTSQGFWRRQCIIPFNANLRSISTVQGIMFKNQLKKQECIDYIAYKAVQAIHRVLTTTMEFTEPQAVKDMLKQYQIDNSSVLTYIKEALKNDVSSLIGKTTQNVYTQYCTWVDNNGFKRVRLTRFISELTREFKLDVDDTTDTIIA